MNSRPELGHLLPFAGRQLRGNSINHARQGFRRSRHRISLMKQPLARLLG